MRLEEKIVDRIISELSYRAGIDIHAEIKKELISIVVDEIADQAISDIEETGKTGNPFCDACKERCTVDINRNCAMIRRYLESYKHLDGYRKIIKKGQLFDHHGEKVIFMGFDFLCGQMSIRLKHVNDGNYSYPLPETMENYEFID